MHTEKLEQLIEAILFYHGEPMKIKALVEATKSSEKNVIDALEILKTSLASRGIHLVHEGEFVGLATAPEFKEQIETLRREELEGPLGKAGL